MAELLFGFTDLSTVRNPNTPILNLGTLVGIPDSYVRKFNPSRYNFYVKFVNGLKDPVTLHKFLYTLNDAKVYHKNIQDKLTTLAKGLNKLSTEDRKKIVSNLKNVLDNNKYDKLYDVIQNFGKDFKISGGAIGDKNGGDDDINPIDTKEFYISKPIAPMQTFLNEINKVAPLLGSRPKTNLNDLIKSPADNPSNTDDKIAIDINKVKSVYEGFKNIPKMNPDRIQISMIDRGIFIGVTFLIRLVTLSLIYWCLNSNLINNFKQAFIYYCIIYILFFIFITALVNVIYYYPIFELFTNVTLTSIPNLLYYFYIHFNGMYSLLFHVAIILILSAIPFILAMDKRVVDNSDMNISFDYKQKTAIYNSIYNFSFVIWILTSVVALKF